VPDSEIPPLVRDGLLVHGVDVGNITPKGLGLADATDANLLITFDVDLPPSLASLASVRRWDEMPSVLESFDVARHAINARVTDLITELERASA
jgi:hypothetical protein